MDGVFEGVLRSSGSLLVGTTGTIVGPVSGLKTIICEGVILGDVAADKVLIGPNARIEGACWEVPRCRRVYRSAPRACARDRQYHGRMCVWGVVSVHRTRA